MTQECVCCRLLFFLIKNDSAIFSAFDRENGDMDYMNTIASELEGQVKCQWIRLSTAAQEKRCEPLAGHRFTQLSLEASTPVYQLSASCAK